MSFHLLALRSLIVSVVTATITLALLFLGFGIWALVISQLMSSYVSAIAGFWSVSWRPTWDFSFTALKELSGYGLYSSATLNTIAFVNQNEQVLVGSFLGTTQLGLYNFAKRVVGVLTSVIAGSLGAVAHPLFSSIQNDKERIRLGFLSATFLSSAVAFPIFAGLAVTSRPIILLVFGNHWSSAVLFVQIQCATGLLTCIAGMQSGLITSQGKANWWFYYQLLSYSTNLVIIAVFAHFGLTILMIVSFLRYFVVSFIPVKMTLLLLSMRANEYTANLKAPIIGTIVMLLSIYGERQILVGRSHIVGLILDISIGAITYCASVYLLEPRRISNFLGTIRLRTKKLD